MSAVLYGVFAALCWSVHDLIARTYAPRIGPMRMGLWIMLLSGILLTAIVLSRGTTLSASGEGLLWSLALGIAYAMGAIGIYKAFSLGPISVVGPLTSAYPVLVVLWGLFHGLAPTLVQWLSIAAAVGGAIIVSRTGDPDGGINAVLPGKLKAMFFACILSSVGYAAAVVLGQTAAVMVGEIEAAWISRSTAIIAFVALAAFEPQRQPIRSVVWLALLAMGILDAAGLIAVNASGYLPGKEFAAIGISGYGSLAVVLAALFLRERVSPPQWAGIALIAAGVIALSMPS